MAASLRANPKSVTGAVLLFTAACLLCVLQTGASGQGDKTPSIAAAPAKEPPSAAIAAARAQAKLMHSIYAATLDSMHHHFFRRERAVLPARALEDVFEDVERQANVKARWIAVNTKAMSINHEPKTDFEKNAAKAIAAGKDDFEMIADGYYHRVGPIPLGSGCISCHTGFFAKAPTSPRFAGLVISVPLPKE